MDLKRLACKTGLGDGPDAKRATAADADDDLLQLDQESGIDKDTSDAQPECLQMEVTKETDCDSLKAERDNLSPSNHVAPYTGNGCAPSLESFMFQQTPAGSQLCSWMSNTESKTSANDGQTLFESDKDSKSNTQTAKLNRKALTNLRRQNALRALELERELATKTPQAPTLLVRFPDPKISVASVSEFSESIRDVVFPTNVAQRYCLVHLKAGANVERTIEELKQVRFGHGRLHAELKTFTDEEQAECIDPCSLYVSNIPFNMNAADIKVFVNSMRVDIGVMKRQKRARYAFVRYANAEMAMDAFRDLVRRTLNNRILTVRYRRLRKRLTHPTAASMCAISNLTIDTIATDDDAVECRVISPPPVESITIMDSDDEGHHCESHSVVSLSSSIPHKKRESKMTAQEKEIQRLKLQVAEHGAIIRSLQKREGSIANVIAKIEPQSDLTTDKSSLMQRSLSPCSSYDIKMENDYLGIAQNTPEPEPDFLLDAVPNSPYRGTTCPIDGMEGPIKCLGRRKSTKSSAQQLQKQSNNNSINNSNNSNSNNNNSNINIHKENKNKKTPKVANLEVLHAQVEADLDT
ncbi:protein painting of fourth isoform X2 [Drosophila hydei]|uniref:Protein painting of fourth isoform X2 n=1 Tax=Drosophila hydei TaxID=7224 RepID=A0A6J1L9M8_DROHY|nr:protein painting of fourth isoform X2 [Drosophila hydei]